MATTKSKPKKTTAKVEKPEKGKKVERAEVPVCNHNWVSNIGGEKRYVCDKCGTESE